MLIPKDKKKQLLNRFFLSITLYLVTITYYFSAGFYYQVSAQVLTNNPNDISIKNERIKEIFKKINNFNFENNTISVDPTQTSLSPSVLNYPRSNNDLELPQNRLPVENLLNIPDEPSSPSTYIQDININPDPNYTPTPLDLAISNNEVTYSQNLIDSVAKCTNTSNLKIYEQASKITAVPVQALAAIHYLEGSCNLNQSLVSGRKIGEIEPDVGKKCSLDDVGLGKPYPKGSGCIFRNTLDSAIYAGFFLRNNKFGGGIPKTIEDYAIAFGNYNGTGNRNCGRTPYRSCPPSFTNDDHIYAMSKFSAKHEEMYVVYCADRVKCDPPKRFNRPGALTIMNIFSKLL